MEIEVDVGVEVDVELEGEVEIDVEVELKVEIKVKVDVEVDVGVEVEVEGEVEIDVEKEVEGQVGRELKVEVEVEREVQVEVEVEDSQVHKRDDSQVHKQDDSQVHKRVPCPTRAYIAANLDCLCTLLKWRLQWFNTQFWENVAEAHNESASLSQTRQPVDSRLAALVRVANLKLIFSRRRDKKLIFEGLVQESLQHGHPFRLAAVWLKIKQLCFACAVNQFWSSSAR